MKKKILVVLLVWHLCVGFCCPRSFGGIVYDPTNYHNALFGTSSCNSNSSSSRTATRNSFTQYNLALRMAQKPSEHARRYRASFRSGAIPLPRIPTQYRNMADRRHTDSATRATSRPPRSSFPTIRSS